MNMNGYLKSLLILTVGCVLAGTVSTVFPLSQPTGPDAAEFRERKAPAGIIPDHVVRYEESLSPQWKTTWDQARQLCRDEKFREALVQYEILLARKENIDEARWEYASLLLFLERWQQASDQLERLLTGDPRNRKYLFGLARVSLETGRPERAARLYGQLREKAADEQEAATAVEGLIRALEQLGDRAATLPLLEELAVQRPDDFAVRKKQAELLMELGYPDRAAAVLDHLEDRLPEDPSVLAMQADRYAQSGNMDLAAVYWQKVIAHVPDSMEAHSALQHYYRRKSNWRKSLQHLEAVLKKTPNSIELLEQAADLNMKIGRIDNALQYYEYGLAIRPESRQLQNGKKEAQKILARDLLVLVEHEGGRKLWQDLVQVTVDRPGIYREIAELLRRKGRTDELIQVLKLLYNENPQDEHTYQELTMLLQQNSRGDELDSLRDGRMQKSPAGH